jgi:hypothetical protein
MGSTFSAASEANYDADEHDDVRRVAPMGRTPRKPRAINDDIYVIGAGTERTNGVYKKVYLTSKTSKAKQGGQGGHLAERNGASVYRNIHGYEISREIIDDEAGWILGKRNARQAYYGVCDSSFLPPPRLWYKTWQMLGADPCPNVTLHHKDAVALGYDEMEEATVYMKAEMERENKIAENVIKKIKAKADERSRAKKVKHQDGDGNNKNNNNNNNKKNKGTKWNVVRSSVENKDDQKFFPVSPSVTRATKRRQRPQALAWQTPDKQKSLKKKLNIDRQDSDNLPQPPMSPVLHRAIEMSANTQEERTEKFNAKREERYQYYQKRLSTTTNNNNNERKPLGRVSPNQITHSNNNNGSTTQYV